MAEDHRRSVEQVAQGIFLLDDPAFLKEIVERVVQELLEAQMTEHIGAPPPTTSAPSEGRNGHRNVHKHRTLRTTRVAALNLLVPQDLKRAPPPPASSPATSATRRHWWRWL